MGNNHSDTKPEKTTTIDPKITEAFQGLSENNETISFEQFEFGKNLAKSLWDYLRKDNLNGDHMTMEHFIQHSKSLMGMSTDIYVKLLMPIDHLLDTCFETENIIRKDSDEKFLNTLKSDIVFYCFFN